MVAIPPSNLKYWIAPVGGLIAGCLAALVALLIPALMLEDLVWNSGIAAVVAVAQPPLGTTARALLALGGGVLVAAVTWSGLFLLFGSGGFFESALAARAANRKTLDAAVATMADDLAFDDDRIPVLRRADAHPDAPARRPLTARDLGVPMPPVEPTRAAPPVIRDLPADLDQPLAAFDPAAVPDAPREPVRPVSALHSVAPRTAPTLAAGERITSVELPRGPIEDGAPSIESLLRRLERSTRQAHRATAR